jgi:hypothetical protein
MELDGRGEHYTTAYNRLEDLITKEGCLLGDSIVVLVDQESSAKKINILAVLAGYDTVIEERKNHWALVVDTRHRRCL